MIAITCCSSSTPQCSGASAAPSRLVRNSSYRAVATPAGTSGYGTVESGISTISTTLPTFSRTVRTEPTSSESTNKIFTPAWSRMYSSSGPARRELSATSTPPASGTAKCAISISGVLGQRYAIRSPGSMRERNTRASRATSSANSR